MMRVTFKYVEPDWKQIKEPDAFHARAMPELLYLMERFDARLRTRCLTWISRPENANSATAYHTRIVHVMHPKNVAVLHERIAGMAERAAYILRRTIRPEYTVLFMQIRGGDLMSVDITIEDLDLKERRQRCASICSILLARSWPHRPPREIRALVARLVWSTRRQNEWSIC